MNQFYLDHGKEVVAKILNGKPLDATHFVYAYVAKSIDYIKYDGGTMLVWYRGQWKSVIAQYVIDSFKDMIHSLAELQAVRDCHFKVDTYGGLHGADSRLRYYDWMPNKEVEYQALKKAIQVVSGEIKPIHIIKVAS